MSENKRTVAQHFSEICASPTNPLDPIYIADFISLQRISPVLSGMEFTRSFDLTGKIPIDTPLILKAKTVDMEKVGIEPPQELERIIKVKEASYQDGQLILSTTDGRLYSTYDFSQEWQQKLAYQRDTEFCQLATQSTYEGNELIKHRTLALVRSMGYDLELAGFKNRSFFNPRLSQLQKDIANYFKEHHLPYYLEKGQRLPDEHIRALKSIVETAVMAPVFEKREMIMEEMMRHCAENDIPLVYAPSITFLETGSLLPMPIESYKLDEQATPTMLTKESPMRTIGELQESQSTPKIIDIHKLDVGYVVLTQDTVYMTFDCADRYEEYLKRNAPEKVAKAYDPAQAYEVDGQISMLPIAHEIEHSWINQEWIDSKNAPITEDELYDSYAQRKQSGYVNPSQELCEAYVQIERTEAFYFEILKQGVRDNKEIVVDCPNFDDGIMVFDGVSWVNVDAQSIEPGMAVNINGESLYVEDILTINGATTIVTPDKLFVDYYTHNFEWTISQAEKAVEQERDGIEIEK